MLISQEKYYNIFPKGKAAEQIMKDLRDHKTK